MKPREAPERPSVVDELVEGLRKKFHLYLDVPERYDMSANDLCDLLEISKQIFALHPKLKDGGRQGGLSDVAGA
jgi:hypothetical protein